jgi:hypothetical protein
MPRTILTDDVILKKCPEFQPLASPNAFFNNVGGAVRSQGIKPVPFRPPPRPSRIEYLSSSARIPLDTLRTSVLLDNEIAEPILERLPVVVEASAPPYPYDYVAPRPLFDFGPQEELEEKTTGEEPMIFGTPVNLIDVMNDDLTAEDERQILAEADLAFEEEGDEASILMEVAEDMISEAVAFRPTRHVIDHRTPVSEGVKVLPVSLEESRRARARTFGTKMIRKGTEAGQRPKITLEQEKQMEKIEQVKMGAADLESRRKGEKEIIVAPAQREREQVAQEAYERSKEQTRQRLRGSFAQDL